MLGSVSPGRPLTDVFVGEGTVCVVPHPAAHVIVELTAVLPIHPDVPVIWLPVVPETEDTIRTVTAPARSEQPPQGGISKPVQAPKIRITNNIIEYRIKYRN